MSVLYDYRFHPKMVFEGIWTLVLLTYAHLVYTSSSIVNCHQLGDKAVSSHVVFSCVDDIFCFHCSAGLSMVPFCAMNMNILDYHS